MHIADSFQTEYWTNTIANIEKQVDNYSYDAASKMIMQPDGRSGYPELKTKKLTIIT